MEGEIFVRKLHYKRDKDFYKECSDRAKEKFNTLFGEKVYIYNMETIFKKVINE